MTNQYQHRNIQGQRFHASDMQFLPVGKVVCVGRNYMDHITELGNAVSELPILFMKPSTALVDMNLPIHLPLGAHSCHNELELAFLIGEKLTRANTSQCREALVGVGLALDLTLRELQTQLKHAGQPWERAKAFDNSCPMSGFVSLSGYDDQRHEFTLHVNGELRQRGDSQLMLNKVLFLVQHISETFTLMPGDVVITGTPKGVGPLHHGDRISAELIGHFALGTEVICNVIANDQIAQARPTGDIS